MGTILVEMHTKRPDTATPDRALALLRQGISIPEMARLWEVSRATVYVLLHRAGWQGRPYTRHNAQLSGGAINGR